METTVVKALTLLEALAFSDGPATLTSLAQTCGQTKSNTHRLLKTLEECRYVRQDAQARTYEPTLRLWELGTRFFGRSNLRAAAAPHLLALAKATGESIYLSTIVDDEVIYIDKVESRHAVRTHVEVGHRAPLYCTGTGKAQLAFSAEETIERICANLVAHTDNTVTDPTVLRHQLAEIRERGYATTCGEWRPGVLAHAAPIHGLAGIAVAGISVVGPEERMRRADAEAQVGALLEAARNIAEALGLTATGPMAPATEAPARRAASRGRAAA